MPKNIRFDLIAQRFQSQRITLMRRLANESVNFFKNDVFEAQGFIDEGVTKWQGRKSKRDNEGRKILVKTGRGRQGIKAVVIRPHMAIIDSTVPYMAYHNTGTKRLPKRQFIGKSKRLERLHRKTIAQHLAKLFKGNLS